MSSSTIFTDAIRRRSTDLTQDDAALGSNKSLLGDIPSDKRKTAVVGAGVAGATCARALVEAGFDVDLFEKSRGAGGRCSTRRRRDEEDRPLHFDHGAQYFTVETRDFRRLVDQGQREGWVMEWKPRLGVREEGSLHRKNATTERFVGVPKMSTLPGRILDHLTPRFSSKIQSLGTTDNSWELVTEDGQRFGEYANLVLSCPAPQSEALLRTANSPLANTVAEVTMTPVLACLIAFDSPLDIYFDAIFINEGNLDWVARNSSKPERPESDCWVLHATPGWSRSNIDEDDEWIKKSMVTEFLSLVDRPELSPDYGSVHRWRYARPSTDRNDGCLLDNDDSLFVCGEWLSGSRIEGAYESGLSAGAAILDSHVESDG